MSETETNITIRNLILQKRKRRIEYMKSYNAPPLIIKKEWEAHDNLRMEGLEELGGLHVVRETEVDLPLHPLFPDLRILETQELKTVLMIGFEKLVEVNDCP